MSILIIGDSYAAQGSINEQNAEYSYQNILRNQYGITVDNYGFPGHSFFKVYNQLMLCLPKIKKYKLVLIIATTIGRIYLPKSNIGIASISNADYLIQRYQNNDVPADHNYPTLDQIKAAKEYYIHLQDWLFETFIHYSIEDSIRNILTKNNVNYILIPVNEKSLKEQTSNDWTLMSMTFEQLKLFHNTPKNFSLEKYREIHGRILNHLTIENNQAFADFIFEKYNGSTKPFDNTVFKPAAVNDFYYYYSSIDN